MWICDRTVLGEVLQPKPNGAVESWLRAQPRIALSVVTVEELFCGIGAADAHVKWLDNFLVHRCEILAVSPQIARRSGQLRGRLRKLGQKRTQADLLVAATALEYGFPLATRNEAAFEKCGVAIMNPFAAELR